MPPIRIQIQVSCYIVLLAKCKRRSLNDLRKASVIDGNPVSYAISSIAVAVFLVVAFAGADLRGSVALVQTHRVYNGALGLAIFASFVLLVMSSMRALFFLANDDVSFIVGAAAVLFISDLVSTVLVIGPSNLDVVRYIRSLLLCYHRSNQPSVILQCSILL